MKLEGIRVLEGMVRSTRDPRMKHRLAQRIERVRQLQALRQAADRYRSHYGIAPASFDAMVEAGLLETMPKDPLHRGFVIDAQGQPTIWFQKSDRVTTVRNRIHLDLTNGERSAEADRLQALGATIADERDDHTVMRDPEGNQFCLFDP